MKTQFTIKFVCPDCGGTGIEEIAYSDYTSSRVVGVRHIGEDGLVSLEYGETIAGGDTHELKYCCTGCGKELVDNETEADTIEQALLDWLRANDMLEDANTDGILVDCNGREIQIDDLLCNGKGMQVVCLRVGPALSEGLFEWVKPDYGHNLTLSSQALRATNWSVVDNS